MDKSSLSIEKVNRKGQVWIFTELTIEDFIENYLRGQSMVITDDVRLMILKGTQWQFQILLR